MNKYDHFLCPIFLLAIGILAISGLNIFGAAILEGAAWKQNIIYTLFVIFALLPVFIQKMKVTWMCAGYALAFFMFGGANIIGTVSIMLALEKVALVVLALFLLFNMGVQFWKTNKLFLLFPLLALIFIACLLPIQDQNIIGSGFDALVKWDKSFMSSDKGFHIFLGLAAIFAAISQFLQIHSYTKQP